MLEEGAPKLLPCLIQIDGKPRNAERRLRKEARKTWYIENSTYNRTQQTGGR